MRIIVQKLPYKPIRQQRVEIVERKGLGHPDYIADNLCEAVSKALCKEYMKTFGTILHHNVDKGLVVGGRAKPEFGGGAVEEPIKIIVAGRATSEVTKEGEVTKVPVYEIALDAMRDALKKTFRFLDVDKHVELEAMVRPGSADLVQIFELSKEIPLANDTSFGVSYAPLTETEQLVLETERFLNSPKLKSELPEVGEDVKVMGVRMGNRITLTIAAAIVSHLTKDLNHYLSVKEEIKKRVEDLASKITDMEVKVDVNTADKPDRGIIYLTVTGTSAEHGDDGNTGRGNRVNGLITPCRPMSLEATAGKNPVSHIGKIYNVLAKKIADRAYSEVKGIEEIYIKMLTQIGHPINDPLIVDVGVIPERGVSIRSIQQDVKGVIAEEFSKIKDITGFILGGEVMLF